MGVLNSVVTVASKELEKTLYEVAEEAHKAGFELGRAMGEMEAYNKGWKAARALHGVTGDPSSYKALRAWLEEKERAGARERQVKELEAKIKEMEEGAEASHAISRSLGWIEGFNEALETRRRAEREAESFMAGFSKKKRRWAW